GYTFSERTYIEKVLIAVGIALFIYLFYLLFFAVFDIILLIFAAILIAVFLRGLADLINRYTRLSETMSVLLVSVLLLAVLGGTIALLAPSIGEQYRHLRDELPNSVQKVSDYLNKYGWGRTILEQLPTVDDITNRIKNIEPSNIFTRVGGYFSTTVGALGNFFITILLAIYLATEPKFYAVGITKLFPIHTRKRVAEVLGAIGETLSWWLIGKVASMLFIGVLTWIGLSILGVPLALTLGLIAGLLSFIPNFGPIFSALPAILLAFIESPMKAVYVLGLFILVQIIESNIVTPLIERQTVELPPALTIIFQLVLGVLIGGLGLVLATPMLAVLMVLIQMVYIQDILGDRDVEIEEKNLKDEETEAELKEESQNE
ncbi:MAG TPA: AI-2E family transporter, partial [Pyrinomonadaceae bacterium]|nr:AI-2E family transporter [Pyrinomonadaceae bacterium]